jgi:hypothetical protein
MFARIFEFTPRIELKDELVKKVRNEILPILKKQNGFLEILPLFPESKVEKVVAITLWTEKVHAEHYEHEVYPKVEAILKPYLLAPASVKPYTVETTLCQHFVEALAA